jgi:hypothetical protein
MKSGAGNDRERVHHISRVRTVMQLRREQSRSWRDDREFVNKA